MNWETKLLRDFLDSRPYEKVTLKGYLAEKPKYQQTNKHINPTICKCVLSVKDETGIEFYNIVCFKNNASKLGKLEKGANIEIKGKKRSDWDLGNKHFKEHGVIVDEITILNDFRS